MFSKYKYLIFSQACAILAIASIILGYLRAQEIGTWHDEYARSFALFAGLLFIMEIKFIRDWVRQAKIAKSQP